MKYLLPIVALAMLSSAARAEDARQLTLNIPAQGKIKVSVEKAERRTDAAGTSTLTVSYDIVNSYSCDNDACTVQSQIPAVTLKSFNGQMPPSGLTPLPSPACLG